MGTNFSCNPEDDDSYHSIHMAQTLYPQSTLRVVSSDTLRAAEEVYIDLQFTPSPSPNFVKKATNSRLPKKIQIHLRSVGNGRKLEPVISGESWDSFAENTNPNPLSQVQTIRRCVSDRQTYLRVKAVGKRSSVPVELLRKQLQNVQLQRSSLPLYLTEPRDDSQGLTRESTERSATGADTPISDIFIDMDTTRSRPGWASVGSSQNNEQSFPSWHEDNHTIHRRIGEILSVESSDSQFAIPTPIKSPIFSNKVRKFANEDEERCSKIVDALERCHMFPRVSTCSSDSGTGSPVFGISLSGGSAFPCSPTPRSSNGSIGGSLFPVSPVPDMGFHDLTVE